MASNVKRNQSGLRTKSQTIASPKKITRDLPAFSDHAGDRHFATTLARGLEILHCFTAEGPILGNKELSERTGLPKPTVSRLTYTLTSLGYLRADYTFGKYRLGPAVIRLSYPLLATIGLRQSARTAIKQFADRSKGSVSIGMRDRLDMVYIESSRTKSIAHRLSDIGFLNPIVGSAMGRAYIAAAEPEERQAIMNEVKLKRPTEWKRFQGGLLRALEDYNRHGFCLQLGELRPLNYAVGVPFRSPSGREIFSFNCVIHSSAIDEKTMMKEIGPQFAAMVRGL